jgi:hypothetical protein
MSSRPRIAKFILALGLSVAWTGTAGRAHGQDPDYRLDGGTAQLQPTAQVRVVMENHLPPEEVDRRLGLVQVAIYLYGAKSAAAPVLEAAAASAGLQPAEGSTVDAPDSRRVTIQVPGIEDDDVSLAFVLGRALRIAGSGALAPAGATVLRADSADLADRLRWGVGSLIPVGQERVVWVGKVPVTTDRIYVDYVAVRAMRVGPRVIETGAVAEPQEMPEGGILALSPTATPANAPPLPASRGAILMRAASGQLQPVVLRRGVLNIVKVTAFLNVLGSPVAGVEVAEAPLLPARR